MKVSSNPDAPNVAKIDETTGSVELEVGARRMPKVPLRQRFELSERLITPANTHLKAEITDIPVSIPARLIRNNVWEIEISPNVLELLSKHSEAARYSGTLSLSASSTLPLTIVLDATFPASSKARPKRSAG